MPRILFASSDSIRNGDWLYDPIRENGITKHYAINLKTNERIVINSTIELMTQEEFDKFFI